MEQQPDDELPAEACRKPRLKAVETLLQMTLHRTLRLSPGC